MDQTSGTTPTDGLTQARNDGQAPDPPPAAEPAKIVQPGFGSRGRARRRARFLRKARELAYRDLGGLVFNLHRFGQRNDTLVLAKLSTIGHIDAELRTIEQALQEREAVTVLREAGITACPRCAAIHSSEDRFCPNCGLPMSRHVDLPVAGAAATPSVSPPASSPEIPQPAPGPLTTTHEAPAPLPSPPSPAARPAVYGGPLGTPQAPAPAGSTHAPVPAQQPPSTSAGRSPLPPSTPPAPPSAFPSSRPHREESTEIIRPGSPGS